MMLDPQTLRRFVAVGTAATGVGFVLTDQGLRPIYADNFALGLLSYVPGRDDTPPSAADVQARLQTILGTARYTVESLPQVPFLSGRRHCLCRSFLLRHRMDGAGEPAVGIVLERQHRMWSSALFDAGRRFKLSPRELETILHLVHGFTTKEIAPRMEISPNTVKQFIRSIMSKMGTTTRAGVLGKIFSS